MGFIKNTEGSVLPAFAVLSIVIVGTAGVAIDYTSQTNSRSQLQEVVDAAVLAGANTLGDNDAKLNASQLYFAANLPQVIQYGSDVATSSFEFTNNGTIVGRANVNVPVFLSSLLFDSPLKASVIAEAGLSRPGGAPCIYILANVPDATSFNSGANISAPNCEINIHSERNPAATFNSNVNLDVNRVCVASANITNNADDSSNIQTQCEITPDPFVNRIPEPIVPIDCETEGTLEGANHIINPGKHCGTIFNDIPNITFAPGTHIITGTMIWNVGANVTAEGVTFYFPDTGSEIRPNGAHTIIATAPTSGVYKDILIFESTSNPLNNENKTEYIFNASTSETLEGLIYLPNRNVTLNGSTNVEANRINIVVNELIVNSGDFLIEPLELEDPPEAATNAYLIR